MTKVEEVPLNVGMNGHTSHKSSLALKNVVGLFGTVEGENWREVAIARLEEEGIAYFNPVVDNWTPELAKVEAEHLATDKVILFVIGAKSKGFGSLAETGWAALSGEQHGQIVIFVLEPFGKEAEPQTLKEWLHAVLQLFDDDGHEDAERARQLVEAHADRAGVPLYSNVYDGIEAAISAYRQIEHI